NVIEDVIKIHHDSSTYASLASAWGSYVRLCTCRRLKKFAEEAPEARQYLVAAQFDLFREHADLGGRLVNGHRFILRRKQPHLPYSRSEIFPYFAADFF